MLEMPEVRHSADFDGDDFAILLQIGLPFDTSAQIRYARSLLQRVHVNYGILKNKYLTYPVENSHAQEVQVGRGIVSSDFCGRWVSDLVCGNVEGHRGVMLGDVDCTGKVVVRHQHLWCSKSSCPRCFLNGWASTLARSIVGRVEEGEKLGLGKPEHVTVSVPLWDRDLPEPVLRKKCAMVAFDRGLTGFAMIPHALRIDRVNKKLVREFHYHLIGYIAGGFDVCRECVHKRDDCASCSGFKGREVRGFRKDGYLVKVHDVRKSIFHTARYQLSHATASVGLKRCAVVTYWGSMACRKYKSFRVPVDENCPACKEEMKKSVKVGKTHVVRDVGSAGYASVVAVPEFDEYGDPNYVDVVEVGRGG